MLQGLLPPLSRPEGAEPSGPRPQWRQGAGVRLLPDRNGEEAGMTRPGPGPPGLPPQEDPAGSAVRGHSGLHNRGVVLQERRTVLPNLADGLKKAKPNKLVSIPE